MPQQFNSSQLVNCDNISHQIRSYVKQRLERDNLLVLSSARFFAGQRAKAGGGRCHFVCIGAELLTAGAVDHAGWYQRKPMKYLDIRTAINNQGDLPPSVLDV